MFFHYSLFPCVSHPAILSMSKKYYEKILAGSGTSSVKVKSAFGEKILAKFGWKEGQGLGSSMSGVSECVQIQKRDERVGIGAESKDRESEWDNWWSGAYDSVAAKINVKISKSVNNKTSCSDSDTPEDDVVQRKKKKKDKKEKKVEEEQDDEEEKNLHKKRRIKRHVRPENEDS
jgi:hypothetical protein